MTGSYTALAPFYDELTRDVDYGRFADLYERLFARLPKKPELVLEIACGTCSVGIELAGRGYDMICTDRSEQMLSAAAEKLSRETIKKKPLLLCQSAEELDLYGTVSAAVCCLDGFNYLDKAALSETLRRLHLFIEPDGMLIFDINSPERLRELDGEVFLDERDDVFCVWRVDYDMEIDACLYGMDLFTLDSGSGMWNREREEHTEYVYTPEFLRGELESHGFVSVETFTEPDIDDQRIFITAIRGQV